MNLKYSSIKHQVLEIGNGPIKEDSNVWWNEMSSFIEKIFLENQTGVGCNICKVGGGVGDLKSI